MKRQVMNLMGAIAMVLSVFLLSMNATASVTAVAGITNDIVKDVNLLDSLIESTAPNSIENSSKPMMLVGCWVYVLGTWYWICNQEEQITDKS